MDLAPDAFAALAAAESIVACSTDPLTVVARQAVAAVLLGGSADPGLPSAFAQQMTLDVAAVTPEQRAEAMAALGRDAFGFVQAVYVADLGTRVRLALSQLFGVTLPAPGVIEGSGGGAARDGELWPAIEELMRCIARLSALDPVTTELVRLRGARAHACRLCQSLRDVRALDAGADEALLSAVEPSSPRHRAAVGLVDAMVWQPASFPPALVASVHDQLSEEEVVEVVLDVARNAGNKVAVALGADAARVTDGVELYTVDAAGDPVYGITR
jgi:hypothetical protein